MVDRLFIRIFSENAHRWVLRHRPKLIALLLALIFINLAVLYGVFA